LVSKTKMTKEEHKKLKIKTMVENESSEDDDDDGNDDDSEDNNNDDDDSEDDKHHHPSSSQAPLHSSSRLKSSVLEQKVVAFASGQSGLVEMNPTGATRPILLTATVPNTGTYIVFFSGSFVSKTNQFQAGIGISTTSSTLPNETTRRIHITANQNSSVATQGQFLLTAGQIIEARLNQFGPNTRIIGATLNYLQVA